MSSTQPDRSAMRAYAWRMVLEGPGFSRMVPFATEAEVYAAARAAAEKAVKGEYISFRSLFRDNDSASGVLRISILWRNSRTGMDQSHARSWSLTRPHPDALVPLPADFHGDS
ncbi:hypothetical protein [Streptomyces sp. NPDC059928]|uniref:hypothetical protein n=1 Tax=unclassified Streptomyces TaxID=2593676 RepID=UPI003646C2B7